MTAPVLPLWPPGLSAFSDQIVREYRPGRRADRYRGFVPRSTPASNATANAAARAADKAAGKRPFWMHQLVEYVLGGLLVAQGLQSPDPVLPSAAGALIMLNAAIARGPWSAFRWVSRSMHRSLDVVVIAAVVVMAVQPVVAVDATGRIVMAGIAFVHAFVWRQSSFTEKIRSRAPISAADGRGLEIGRLAGRAVGDGINAAKRFKK